MAIIDVEENHPAKPEPGRWPASGITVREVTHHEITWSECSRGEAWAFTIHLLFGNNALAG